VSFANLVLYIVGFSDKSSRERPAAKFERSFRLISLQRLKGLPRAPDAEGQIVTKNEFAIRTTLRDDLEDEIIQGGEGADQAAD